MCMFGWLNEISNYCSYEHVRLTKWNHRILFGCTCSVDEMKTVIIIRMYMFGWIDELSDYYSDVHVRLTKWSQWLLFVCTCSVG